MHIRLREYELKLKHAFTISRGSRDKVHNVIVELTEGKHTGLGEATENPYYHIDTGKINTDLLGIEELLKDHYFTTPEKLWQEVAPLLNQNPFALCALDEAAHDLYGKIHQKPLYKLWKLDVSKAPLSNYTLGIDEVDVMIEKMKQTPWPLYKIKLGNEHDLEIIKALRNETDAIFRVDANGGWSADQCIRFSEEFKPLGVEFIEQPLHADARLEEKTEAFKHSKLPLIADESCILEEDVAECKPFFHGVNIKLMKCGGITPALRMVREAKTLGLKVMVGCMTESSVGISAIAQLAPLLDYIDMDGAMLLSNDPAEGVGLSNGKILFSEKAGTGAVLH